MHDSWTATLPSREGHGNLRTRVPTFDALLRDLRGETPEVDVGRARRPSSGARRPALIDVPRGRRARAGDHPGRGPHPARLPRAADREGGRRSRGADRRLLRERQRARCSRRAASRELGYTNVRSLAGGFTAWKRAGLPWEQPAALRADQEARYSRHTMLPEVGVAGQLKLLAAKVLCIGAGGLGSPSSMYLAAAGIGTIGMIDDDVVDASNLQRQILHGTDRVGDAEGRQRRADAARPQPRRQGRQAPHADHRGQRARADRAATT